MEMNIRQYLRVAKEQRDRGALQEAFGLITDTPAGGRTPELCVVCAETAQQIGCLDVSAACLKMYFEGNPPANQFLCRAYLCQGRLKTPPAAGTVEDFDEAVQCFLKAIEISKPEARCHFLVFNASVLYLQAVRPLLQPGRCLHLLPSLQQVVRSLEEVDDQDHSWRAELMMHLIDCLVFSGKTEDAADVARAAEELVESHSPRLYPRLFNLLVQHKLRDGDVLEEKSRHSAALQVIYKMQEFKSRLQENKEWRKEELEQILHLLRSSTLPGSSSPRPSPTPIQAPDRVAFLLELALLALRVKHQEVAANCLKEFKAAGEASVGQCIIMECVNCELNLVRRAAKMNDYSKAGVEARLKEIGRLDQCLQAAVREGDPRAVQAVCATLWTFCLPLLQHNLRNRVKTPLLRLARALEDTQSQLLEMRCQVHSELAVMEEEEGRLEPSLTHLHKALLLDNGTQRGRLSSALHLLQLRGTLYQTPPRTEDKAAMLLQQTRDVQSEDKTDVRPVLVAVGLLLAPDEFQTVLDADDPSTSFLASGPAARLAAKAQHHSASVWRVDGHLARQGGQTDDAQRVKLWAALVKAARKQEVWDVCRAAARFCLLYDDERWKISKSDGCRRSEEEADVKDVLLLLAEICFISAEATVLKLRAEGEQLNSPPAPPGGGDGCEEDPQWAVYRDWIQSLSAYATSSFMRAAELGVEIAEPWVVANAAVYLWNYSRHLVEAGEYRRLLPAFQRLVEMIRNTEYTGNPALLVLLCDAVARGLIQPLSGPDRVQPDPAEPDPAEPDHVGPDRVGPDRVGPEPPESNSGGRAEGAASIQRQALDPAGQQDVCRARELCGFALRVSGCSTPEESVPIAARKQLAATWVQTERLLRRTGSKTDPTDEDLSAMTRLLIAVETLQCSKNQEHAEFPVPTLVGMASECSWADAVVELQVWCQLATFCHSAKDGGLVLCCTEKALQLEEAAAKTLSSAPRLLYGPTAVNEMLSGAACLRGLALLRESSGNLHTCREAMELLLSGVSYAEKAKNPTLCATAARHYWASCLALTQTPEERRQLQEPLEKVLSALVQTNTKHGKVKGSPTLTAMPPGSSKHEATDDEDVALRAAIYSLLFHIRADEADWKGALQLLNRAVGDVPRGRHQLALLKERVLVKARLGESVQKDMEKLQKQGEQCSSHMWHQVALCTENTSQRLSCYQNSISALQSAEARWQKVGLLLEFGEWLYCHNFPTADAQLQVQWAVDVLLPVEAEQAEESIKRDVSESPVQDLLFTHGLSDLKDVRRLDSLLRAHTLLAVMADRTSAERQVNLLRACSCVLQIWQVSMEVVCQVSGEMVKGSSPQPPPSAGGRRGKDKGKGKTSKNSTPAEERPRPVVVQDRTLPSGPAEWAGYACPEPARQVFRLSSDPHCVNAGSVSKQTRSLFYLDLLERELRSLSLEHLTLPIMHLAEVIAHDLLDRKSLSDLYRLRIVRTCSQLALEAGSPYQEELLRLSRIQEQEQARSRKAVLVSREQRGRHEGHHKGVEGAVQAGRQTVSAQDVWLDKAEVCLSVGLHDAARQLLAEAHSAARELRDQRAVARSLLGLASLACDEQDLARARILLDRAEALGGDEEFWYQLTLTRVSAAVGLRDPHTEIGEIIGRGCEALRLVLDQRVNRASEITFFITSLEMRGATEGIRALDGVEPGETLSLQDVQRLQAACDSLRECAGGFTKLGCRKQAAEAHAECARGLRFLSSHSARTEDKRRLLLDGLSHMQLAVAAQEHVALNAQRLLPSQEEGRGLSLAAARRRRRLRLALADFCLAALEERCAERTRRAVARETKSAAEILLEEFTRGTPEPDSVEQEWVSVGATLGQLALDQLDAVSADSADDVETRARSLSLRGKYLRLLALQEDPLWVRALWDPHKQAAFDLTEEEEEEEEDGGSSRRETPPTSARSAELQPRPPAQQLLAQAGDVLSEVISLSLQHKLPSSVTADASLGLVECHGRSDPALAGQHLALFQSCCAAAAAMAELLNGARADPGASQLAALLGLRRKLLVSQEERPGGMLRGVEDSLKNLSKAFSQLTISHPNVLAELPPDLKILLLQHSEDGSQLYGAVYEADRTPTGRTEVPGTLACSSVAKVSVCPQALLALRERTRAFGRGSGPALLQEACWHTAEGRLPALEAQRVPSHKTSAEETLAPAFRGVVEDMEDYLNPLLLQLDFSSFRPQDASLPDPDVTASKEKEKEEKGSSEAEEHVVLLADWRLLDLPLEALSVLQDGPGSASRDFSLQVLHGRLSRNKPEKGSLNTKPASSNRPQRSKKLNQ